VNVLGTKNEDVSLKIVKSKNTSRQCPKCEYIDQRNRKSRNDFECLQCRYNEIADYVAAKNIDAKVRVRAAVNQRVVAENSISSYKPRSYSVG
jgi:putative transposase